jgi:hypothetical protein
MPFQPGQSGNPGGRPPKSRALTAILEKRGNSTCLDIDGKKRGGKHIVARALWELATTGTTQLANGEEVLTLSVGSKGWFEVVKWLYGQIDGPPPRPIEVSGKEGEPIEVNVNSDDIIRKLLPELAVTDTPEAD